MLHDLTNSDIDNARKSGAAHTPLQSLSGVLIGFSVIVVVGLLFRPAFQTVHKWRPHQARKNLQAITIALHIYLDEHQSFPYHEDGSDHALYLLADEIEVNCFDSYPHENPTPEAYWDDQNQRLFNSDFVYLNDPKHTSVWEQKVILVEKPHNSDQRRVMVALCDGRITSCNIPTAGYRDLLGNYETLDGFWIKDPELYKRWEAMPLPSGVSTSWGSKLRHRVAGDARVDYVYEGEHLKQRVWSSPAGTVTETIQTDDAGRIVGLSRTPENWRDFWPWQAE